MRVDAAILAFVVAFLLPLRLLSLLARVNSTGSAGDLRRSCASFAVAAALLAAIFALPRDHGGHRRECPASIAATAAAGGQEGFRREVRLEIEQLKLQLDRLESFWENNSKALDGKTDGSKVDDDVVKAMGLDIQSLIDRQENIKVQILVDESIKMNSDINQIWSLAKDTENRVEDLHSDVKRVQITLDESKEMNSNIHQIWSLAKDTEKRVEALFSDMKKVQTLIDESRHMESIYKMWSFAKQTEKRVEDLYSDVKKSMPSKSLNTFHGLSSTSDGLQFKPTDIKQKLSNISRRADALPPSVQVLKEKGIKVPSWTFG